MWQGLQEITDYKKKTSHVTDTDVTVPDKLNTFFVRFEHNTVPPLLPADKDYPSPPPSPWPT
jgi:lipopolysaccharide biosynthesis protein